MHKSILIAEKTGSGYYADVPDIPGIATIAETFNELQVNVKEIMKVCVQISQYVSRIIKPGRKQLQRIEKTNKRFSGDSYAISFYLL